MTVLKAVNDPGNEKGSGWIATYTGRQVFPLDPDPSTLDILDIAHSLANQCRFTGHTRKFYSTAQHSVLVSSIVPAEDALWGLLHDASEAYISDIARPVKRQPEFGKFYSEAEDILMEAVCKRYGLSMPMPKSVKLADDMVLRAEQRDLMPNDPSDGDIYEEMIIPWTPYKAKGQFLNAYAKLTGAIVEGYYPAGRKGMGVEKEYRIYERS